MKSNNTWMILQAVALVVAVSASGCAWGIATGGGTIPAKSPTKGATKANFGFWGDSCGGTTTGNFNYHDKSVYDPKGGGLKMVGPVQATCDCSTITNDAADAVCQALCGVCDGVAVLADWIGTDGRVAAIEAHYYSTNPKVPGEGTVYACVIDNGEGGKVDKDDALAVKVANGPFAGYINWGEVSGNIQAYPCPE